MGLVMGGWWTLSGPCREVTEPWGEFSFERSWLSRLPNRFAWEPFLLRFALPGSAEEKEALLLLCSGGISEDRLRWYLSALRGCGEVSEAC